MFSSSPSFPSPPPYRTWCRFCLAACLWGIATHAAAQESVVSDRAALVAVYNATDGPNWTDNTNWLSNEPLGEWEFVRTDGVGGRVTSLNSYGNQLRGEIPAALGNLTNLRGLQFSQEPRLSGEIPAALGNLTNLRSLVLWETALRGEIPDALGNLTNLVELFLASNRLSGEIPPNLGSLTRVWNLGLADNALSGEIPTALGNMASLTFLRLGGNALRGEIPAALGNLTNLGLRGHAGVGGLLLSGNQFNGEIPAALGNLTNLVTLHLNDNALSGEIPVALGNLTRLRSLFLAGNQLTGRIPIELANLRGLLRLSIDSDTGLCLPPDFPAVGSFAYLAQAQGVPACSDEPAATVSFAQPTYTVTEGGSVARIEAGLTARGESRNRLDPGALNLACATMTRQRCIKAPKVHDKFMESSVNSTATLFIGD